MGTFTLTTQMCTYRRVCIHVHVLMYNMYMYMYIYYTYLSYVYTCTYIQTDIRIAFMYFPYAARQSRRAPADRQREQPNLQALSERALAEGHMPNSDSASMTCSLWKVILANGKTISTQISPCSILTEPQSFKRILPEHLWRNSIRPQQPRKHTLRPFRRLFHPHSKP